MDPINDVLNSLNITPEELEILRNNIRVINWGNDDSFIYRGVGYNNDAIWRVNYKDLKLSSIEMYELPNVNYNSIKDIAIIVVLANLTTMVLSAYIKDEKDAIALKGIEHLLYNGSVFRVISNCGTADYPNIGLKCFILKEIHVLLDENRLFNPMFTLIHLSSEICSRTTGLYPRNILLTSEKVFPYIKEKDLNSVTIHRCDWYNYPGKEDKIMVKYITKENLANSTFKELTLSKVMKKLQRLDPSQMKSARR